MSDTRHGPRPSREPLATLGMIERAVQPEQRAMAETLPDGALATLPERRQDRIVRQLFYRLAALYGAQWQNQFVGDENMAGVIKAEWRYRLRAISPERIAIGIERLDRRPAKDRRFVPGVLEFVDLCKPDAAELGIPSRREAYREMLDRRYTHPLVARVHVDLGRSRMAGLRSDESWREWSAAYDAALDAARDGETFEWPAGTSPADRAVTYTPPPKASAATARRFLDRIRGKQPGASNGQADQPGRV